MVVTLNASRHLSSTNPIRADRGRRGQVRKTDAPGEPGIGGRRERPRPSAGRAGAPESPAPFRPPLVPIGWRIQDRLRGLARPLSDESALVTILDLDATTKPAVFAEPDAATPAYRIVFPGAFPSERCPGFGWPHVERGEQAMHPNPVSPPRDCEHGRTEI